MAAHEPTLPKPWMAADTSVGFRPSFLRAARADTITPRPVASVRPSEPPITRGLPVTTAGVVMPLVFENSSISHAISRGPVPMSGAGMSRSGPNTSFRASV